ncbi:MAG: hypothetical protein R3B09_24905 [Nannocystaceae bacterium]
MTSVDGQTIFANAFTVLTLDRALGILWMIRTREPLPSLAVLRADIAEMEAALERLDLKGLGLIIDTRAPVGRNDPEFEGVILGVMEALVGRFARGVILIRTAVGRLQASRFAREVPAWRALPVTDDVDEAIRVARRPTSS